MSLPIELKGYDLALVDPEIPWLAFCFSNLQVDHEHETMSFDYTVVQSAKEPHQNTDHLDFDAMADRLINEFIDEMQEDSEV